MQTTNICTSGRGREQHHLPYHAPHVLLLHGPAACVLDQQTPAQDTRHALGKLPPEQISGAVMLLPGVRYQPRKSIQTHTSSRLLVANRTHVQLCAQHIEQLRLFVVGAAALLPEAAAPAEPHQPHQLQHTLCNTKHHKHHATPCHTTNIRAHHPTFRTAAKPHGPVQLHSQLQRPKAA